MIVKESKNLKNDRDSSIEKSLEGDYRRESPLRKVICDHSKFADCGYCEEDPTEDEEVEHIGPSFV